MECSKRFRAEALLSEDALSGAPTLHIASFLEDATPFAVARKALRCCSHFEKYVGSSSEWLTPWTRSSCARCRARIVCRVERHRHIEVEQEFCGFLYEGAAGDERSAEHASVEAVDESSYAWFPRCRAILCRVCYRAPGKVASFLHRREAQAETDGAGDLPEARDCR